MTTKRYAIAVESSQNGKIGRTSATYATQASCPRSCPFFGNGCYAEVAFCGITTRRLNAYASTLDLSPETIAETEAREIAALTGKLPLRVHVVGDCRTDGAASLVGDAMVAHTAKHGQFAWTYTHAWRDVASESWHDASVLASCETGDDVRAASARGYATAIVVSEHPSNKVYAFEGVKVLPCPGEVNDAVTCASCGLCGKATTLRERGLTVGFAAHSARAAQVKQALDTKRGKV